MFDATMNLGLGSLVLVMSLTGPWRKDSWWPARILFQVAGFNVVLGIAGRENLPVDVQRAQVVLAGRRRSEHDAPAPGPRQRRSA